MDMPRGLTLDQAYAERIGREIAELRQEMQNMMLTLNARNAENQPRRRRVVEDEASNEESGASSRGSDSDHEDRRRRRRDNRPQ